VKRVQKERSAVSDEDNRRYLAEAHQNLASFDLLHPKPQGEAVRTRKDLEERITQLASLQKAREDHGTILDVVAWFDGRLWRAAIGTRKDGDLTDAPALANFAAERKCASFGELEQMNYCLNVFDEGHVVSIVCDISSHGTHAAGICAACHPDEPARNGVAPGAQIISLKIADTRLDCMETGMGLARAFAHCVKAKVDLINLSFGEGASPAAVGRVVELAQRVVQQHGIIFVTSAGNDGPGLSTMGAPATGSDSFVCVGAHVSPPAMESQYSMLKNLASTPYTWTSRGPTQDGSLGVTICAPGSAITSIPNWTLSGAQLMNGTSMASPNACGGLALVCSALKAAAASWSPASILRGIKASALPLPSADQFAIGSGMIQVESCYEHMMTYRDVAYQDVAFNVSVPGRGRGIYLREPHESSTSKVFLVKVDPHYREFDSSLNRSKIDLELNIALVSSVSWVKAPTYFVLPAAGRSFSVSVDPSGLQQGEAHLGFVSGFDTSRPQQGALFKVPVTVIRAVAPTSCPQSQEPSFIRKMSVRCSPGSLHRTFAAIPAGCTWAEFTLITKAFDGSARTMVLHVIQDVPHVPGTKTNQDSIFRFTVAGTQKKSFRVESPGTLEVTLGQYWNCLGDTEADLEICFYGITPEVTKLMLSADNPIASANVLSGPGAVTVKPTASLNTHRTSLRPTSAKIQPGGERDLYMEGKRVYDLVLEYALKLEEDGEVTPQALLLNDRLYESVFEGQMIMIYDSNKRFVGSTDCWPTPLKMKKGEYVARLQVRHDDAPLLEKLKTMPLSIDRKLEKPITIKAYPSFNNAITAQGEFGEVKVKGGVRTAIFFTLPVDEKLPDTVKPGDQLLGPVGFGEPSFPVTGKKCRGGYTVSFVVTVPKAEEKKEAAEDDDLRTSEEKLSDAMRDAQIEHLKTLRKWATRDEHRALMNRLLQEYSRHLPLYLERILAIEEIKDPDLVNQEKEIAAHHQKENVVTAVLGLWETENIVSAVDEMLDQIDLRALAAHLGRRVDKDDRKAVQAGKEWDKTRDAVVQGLTKKLIHVAKNEGKMQVVTAFKELSCWVDTTEAKHARVVMLYERALGHLGLSLSALNKEIGEEKAAKRELLEERADLLEQLGWMTWAEQERQSLSIKFPKAYSRF